jgi:hypothetical protein
VYNVLQVERISRHRYQGGYMPKVIKMGLRPELDVKSMSVTMRVMEGKEQKGQQIFHWADIDPEIQDQLKLAGLSTVLQQRTSDVKADPLQKVVEMIDVFGRFMIGEWAKEREGGARLVAPIIEVLATLKEVPEAAIQKSWAKQTDEFKEAVLKKYATEIEAVVTKRADAEEVDISDLA